MKTELPKQAERYEDACNVGNQPTRVSNNLKNGVVGGFVHLILVKGFARMTERCVHVNESFPGVAVFQFQIDVTFKIEGNFSALIELVFNAVQFDRKGKIFAFMPETDAPKTVVMPERLKCKVGKALVQKRPRCAAATRRD